MCNPLLRISLETDTLAIYFGEYVDGSRAPANYRWVPDGSSMSSQVEQIASPRSCSMVTITRISRLKAEGLHNLGHNVSLQARPRVILTRYLYSYVFYVLALWPIIIIIWFFCFNISFIRALHTDIVSHSGANPHSNFTHSINQYDRPYDGRVATVRVQTVTVLFSISANVCSSDWIVWIFQCEDLVNLDSVVDRCLNFTNLTSQSHYVQVGTAMSLRARTVLVRLVWGASFPTQGHGQSQRSWRERSEVLGEGRGGGIGNRRQGSAEFCLRGEGAVMGYVQALLEDHLYCKVCKYLHRLDGHREFKRIYWQDHDSMKIQLATIRMSCT